MTDPRSTAQRVLDEAWNEFRYPRPATDEPTPGFRRAIAAALEAFASAGAALEDYGADFPEMCHALAAEIREGR
jgi:hypothetical protein